MKKQRIGFQGALGAFSQEAVVQLLGDDVTVVPHARFEDVFRALIRGKIDAAVIPMENTLAGSVHENYDHLLHFDVRIVAETNVRIIHNLIAPPGVKLKEIRKVYSHPVALNQCLRFFAAASQDREHAFLRHGGQRGNDHAAESAGCRGHRVVSGGFHLWR